MPSDFYNFYVYLEKTYYNASATHLFDGVKFTRLFNFPSVTITTKALAEKLTEYVKHFDELLNLYFNNHEKGAYALALVEKRFIELKTNCIVF